jgi:hypothetical protein
MKKNWITYFLTVATLVGCSGWKKTLISQGDKDDAIKNAITDFLHSRKYAKRDSIFSVRIVNLGENIIGVSLFGQINKLKIYTKNEVDYSYDNFPSDYLVQNGKLFFWRDSTKKASDKLINMMSKMKLIDTVIVGKFGFNSQTDDSKKGVDYYFCKSNLKIYRRVYTTYAMGYYDAPKIDCEH